jgi:hypothetical protein
MTAYNEAREHIQEFTKDIDNNVLKEAIEGAANVLVFGMVFKLIQTQEAFLDSVFDKVQYIVGILLVTPMNKIRNKLRGLRGMKLFNRLGIFGDSRIEKAQVAQVVATLGMNQVLKRKTGYSAGNSSSFSYSTALATKNMVYNRENLHMQFGANMANRYGETLLFKLLTKSFTPNDELLMKKILGRDSASTLNIDDLNKVANFMYTTDSNGNPIGLSEAFIDMLNGLGFLHNK